MTNEYLEQYKKTIEVNNKKVRNSTINECIQIIDEYFKERANSLPEDATWDIIERYVLDPNREIRKRLSLMR